MTYHCTYFVICFADCILGKQTITLLKEGRSGILSLYSITSRTSLLRTTEGMKMIMKTIPSSKFFDFHASLWTLTMGLTMIHVAKIDYI